MSQPLKHMKVRLDHLRKLLGKIKFMFQTTNQMCISENYLVIWRYQIDFHGLQIDHSHWPIKMRKTSLFRYLRDLLSASFAYQHANSRVAPQRVRSLRSGPKMLLGCAGVPLKKGRQNPVKIPLFQTSPNMCDKPAVKKKNVVPPSCHRRPYETCLEKAICDDDRWISHGF